MKSILIFFSSLIFSFAYSQKIPPIANAIYVKGTNMYKISKAWEQMRHLPQSIDSTDNIGAMDLEIESLIPGSHEIYQLSLYKIDKETIRIMGSWFYKKDISKGFVTWDPILWERVVYKEGESGTMGNAIFQKMDRLAKSVSKDITYKYFPPYNTPSISQ